MLYINPTDLKIFLQLPGSLRHFQVNVQVAGGNRSTGKQSVKRGRLTVRSFGNRSKFRVGKRDARLLRCWWCLAFKLCHGFSYP